MKTDRRGLSWLSIVRLGLVQASLGAVVVMMTSTLNRIMVVELGLAATVPGFLVGLHYAVQLLRPVWGHGSDGETSRTRWIIGGMAVLAGAGVLATLAVPIIEQSLTLGLALAFLAFVLIGFGVGASGTCLLALLAARTAPTRRAAAATLVWVLMLVGFIVTTITAGSLLDPYSHSRLIGVMTGVSASALALTVLALWGVERRSVDLGTRDERKPPFREALRETWRDGDARLFTVFVLVSMVAYSAQDLILEPFGGIVHGLTPGETTKLGGMHHQGVLIGMLIVGAAGGWLSRRLPRILTAIVVAGCLLSGVALVGLATSIRSPGSWPLGPNVFALGLANGAFAVAAIGSMLALAASGPGGTARTGVRMGVFGAAQAIGFALGGVVGTVAVDLAGWVLSDTPNGASYRAVFMIEASLFVVAAMVATRLRLAGAVSVAAPDADLATMRFEGASRPLEPAE